MRIGKFNQILQLATEESGTLQTSGEPIYGGQAYRIKNFKRKAKLVEALDQLKLLPDTADASTVKLILGHASEEEFLPETTQHDQIVALFTQINTKLPDYSEIAKSFSPDQEETIINVKLPDGLDSIEQLQKFNGRLSDIFKKFNINGKFKVVGFDKGSEWYEILIVGIELFNFVIASVDLSLRIIEFRDNRKDSDDLRLARKALDASNKNNTLTENKLLKGMVDEKISEDVGRIVDDLGCPDGREKPETVSMIVGAVKELIKEIDNGAEFHLSLNPPEYAKENGGGKLTIDYKSIPKIEISKEKKQIDAGKKNQIDPTETK
jgi:hypothetical protein